MKTVLRLIRGVVVIIALLAAAGPACPDDPIEGTGEVGLDSNAAALLPPGHPGYVDGSRLILPAETVTPLIHYANCFAGVPYSGDIGIGSAAGYTRTFIGLAILPINVNLGYVVLGSYSVEVTVTDPALQLVSASVDGSYGYLSTSNCAERCFYTCTSQPSHYPDQFIPALGFEGDPTVTTIEDGIRIEASDAAPLSPSTGVLNIANVPIRIVGALPSAGAVVTFTVISLKDDGGADIPHNAPYQGIVIENFRIE